MARRSQPCPICSEDSGHHANDCLVVAASWAHQEMVRTVERGRQERADLVKKCRDLGVTQQALADALGITKHAVQLIEGGDR